MTAGYVKDATTYDGTLEEVLTAIVYGIDADEDVSMAERPSGHQRQPSTGHRRS
ncbi:MAG: hypothetical protein MZU79_03060 [Anaerotruncus sp.]|nr:hypothetical protein [Anaerotruncus sp.]